MRPPRRQLRQRRDEGRLAIAQRVVTGERELRDEAMAAWPEDHRVSVGRLLDDPDGELRALRRVLRAWRERFEPIEARIARTEESDVAERRSDLGRLSLQDFVEQATSGVRWVPEPGTRRLYLSPSYFTRPYNYVFGGRDWHMFAYPLAESALDGDGGAVPAASVRLFKALGDESRLRILQLLASGDLYLTEIAERMGLSKPTLSHQLALLRASGLVTITETGALTYYTLRRDRIADAGVELTRLLGGPTPAAGALGRHAGQPARSRVRACGRIRRARSRGGPSAARRCFGPARARLIETFRPQALR